MRPFIVSDELKTVIKRIAEYAQQHVYKDEDRAAMNEHKMPIPGDMKEHTIHAPFGYKIVFSVQESGSITYRVLSMSVDTLGKMPNPYVIKEVMNLFGYKNELEDCIVRFDDFAPGRKAIQVIEEL